VIAEAVAQRRGDIRVGANTVLGEGFVDELEQRLVAVGETGQGAAQLFALDKGAKRVLGRKVAGFEDDRRPSRVIEELRKHHDQRLAGTADTNNPLLPEE